MDQLTDYDISNLSPESEIDFKRCFVEDAGTGRIRFTAKGFAEYGSRFAKAGIDINQVRSRDQLREACIRSDAIWADDIRQMVKGHKELEEILKSLWS